MSVTQENLKKNMVDAVGGVQENLQQNVEQVSRWLDALIEFGVTYGFQIAGSLVFLFIGLKIASWVGRRVQKLAEGKDIDVTLSKFIGSVTKVGIVAILVVITLGNFGIDIAPLIALAGAGAFGATLAIQGPLSNYGAGLSIIMARPFTVGNTITVENSSGVVEDVKMAHTVLVGEDGERITVPNKEIVGKVIVNSETKRVVQTKVSLAADADIAKAIKVAREAVEKVDGIADHPVPQIGLHDFTYGGLVLGVRFWVPSSTYYDVRYAVNQGVLMALRKASVPLMTGVQPAVLAETFSGDGVQEGKTDET